MFNVHGQWHKKSASAGIRVTNADTKRGNVKRILLVNIARVSKDERDMKANREWAEARPASDTWAAQRDQ